ncbi:MAG TPA: hypothetical protein VFL79_03255 [Terriglobia bacterium]|nr:hypothetical protein [Terriglobia bacterium]
MMQPKADCLWLAMQPGGQMARFRKDPDCAVFLSTDAGGAGLNLQSASETRPAAVVPA